MSKKIYISPSSQPDNMYAVGNVSEQTICRRIASELKEELDRCGFTAYAATYGTMYTRAAESDKLGVDLHLPIHTNACNGKVAGLRIMVYKMGGEAEQIARAIDKYLAPITPGESDGISAQPQLYEIKATGAPCVYIEAGFHDNPEEAQWLIDHTKETAVAICKGLCEHYGVEYVPEGFRDVPEGVFYTEAVQWAVANGITKGIDAAHFGPEQLCTRAQVVTFLWRFFGAPEPKAVYVPFEDVQPTAYYAKAVQWAVDRGVTNGVDAAHFCPEEPCTRGQIVTFMWRSIGSPAAKRDNPFQDVEEGKFYHDAVLWAVEQGITKGMDAEHFCPDHGATRAQVVTFLYRMSLAV